MKICKQIKDYFVFTEDNIIDALKKITLNQSQIICVVDYNGKLKGVLSDGDFRRWITHTREINLNLPIHQIMNKNFTSFTENDLISSTPMTHKIIPITDKNGRLVAIAHKSPHIFKIGNFNITDSSNTFIIAEIGNNHNGDINLAKKLVDLAIEANADCVKFQMRDLRNLYLKNNKIDASYDLGSQYTLDLLSKFQLKDHEMFEVFDYCYNKGILPLCTPWDISSLVKLEKYGMEGYKVASADFTNYKLLEELAKTNKPLICSTGMTTESELKNSVTFLNSINANFTLLHCNSTYPTPFKDVNLNYINRLKNLFPNTIIGYSGHERGIEVPIAAVAIGAKIIEKHFTIDKAMEGNDHKVSLLPQEFADMVQKIRNIESALGQTSERQLTQGELINRENLAKSLLINQNLSKGETILKHMIEIRSPGQGLQPNRIEELIGKKAKRDFTAGDLFFESDLTQLSEKKENYIFNRPFGIPVRYHDYGKLTQNINLDFVEFHLSYHDLDVDFQKYILEIQNIDYAVHSPELFSGDHILDLASTDDLYRNHSIAEFKRVIEITQKIGKLFPKTKKPVLVLNAGGWSTQDFISSCKKKFLYDNVVDSLSKLNLSNIELAIQTMPPFPWHFGGQSYHNIFVDPDEIVEFCKKTNYKICLDISHSMMACNYYNWNFRDFLKKVLPYTVHLHIVDAQGIDGEGVQIGEGDVDFDILKLMLDEHAKNIQFIPEVWQGHKDNGNGFWHALNFLENKHI